MATRSTLAAIMCGLLVTLASRGSSTNALVNAVAQLDESRILQLASEAINRAPPAITDSRATNSAGGLHDYFSQADYYWPNPHTKSGFPYLNRDGYSNPTNFSEHRLALRTMKDSVAALAAAYSLTGNDAYAVKAQEFLRVFFLDPATRMNPSLNYAQAILGTDKGTQLGIIDTLHLAELAVAIPFLEKSPSFDPAVDAGMKQWFTNYIRWMTTSSNGKQEMRAPNNHSIAYDLQIACFARLVGDQKNFDLARQRFERTQLPGQMATTGSFPRELKRTKPFGYSNFQADNVAILCFLFSTPQTNVWQFRLPKKVTAERTTQFIYPYLANKQQWLEEGRRMDVEHWDGWPVRQASLLFAYVETSNATYFDLWKTLNPDPSDLEVRRNLAITQPLLWLAQPAEIPLLVP